MRFLKTVTAAALLALSVSGCTYLFSAQGEMRQGVSSSLVDYLYPGGRVPPEYTRQIPQLTLPLRVGIAFVPAKNQYDTTLSEAHKSNLLQGVRTAFIERDYIAHIEVIPETYLRSGGGFDSLEQVARLYGVDVMALVSYDQLAVTEDRESSLLYWTIVGAYVVKGSRNEVQTFVDTAVFDIPTRKLLFRAPGTNVAQENTTAIESDANLRRNRTASFEAAMADMTGNLLTELDQFEVRVREQPEVAQVAWRDGQGRGGGGAIGFWTLSIVLLAIVFRRRPRLCS